MLGKEEKRSIVSKYWTSIVKKTFVNKDFDYNWAVFVNLAKKRGYVLEYYIVFTEVLFAFSSHYEQAWYNMPFFAMALLSGYAPHSKEFLEFLNNPMVNNVLLSSIYPLKRDNEAWNDIISYSDDKETFHTWNGWYFVFLHLVIEEYEKLYPNIEPTSEIQEIYEGIKSKYDELKAKMSSTSLGASFLDSLQNIEPVDFSYIFSTTQE